MKASISIATSTHDLEEQSLNNIKLTQIEVVYDVSEKCPYQVPIRFAHHPAQVPCTHITIKSEPINKLAPL